MKPAYRQETEDIEAAGKLWARPVLEALLKGTLARVDGRAFQFKDGDYQVVDYETGRARSLELKCRGLGGWHEDAPVLLERGHDKDVVPGWAMTSKSQLLAYAWEDTRGVLVLDAQKVLAWYRSELRRRPQPRFIVRRREPRLNARQPNQTVFDCVTLDDVQPFIIAVDLGLARPAPQITAPPPAQPRLFG